MQQTCSRINLSEGTWGLAELPVYTRLPRLRTKSVLDPASSRSGQSGHMFLGVEEQVWEIRLGRAARLEAESALGKSELR